jgi:hypothetical protein
MKDNKFKNQIIDYFSSKKKEKPKGKLKDISEEIIEGSFYAEELQKTKVLTK